MIQFYSYGNETRGDRNHFLRRPSQNDTENEYDWKQDSWSRGARFPLALSFSSLLIVRSQFVPGPHHSFRKQLSVLLCEPAEHYKDSFLIASLPNNQAHLTHNALPLVAMFSMACVPIYQMSQQCSFLTLDSWFPKYQFSY